MSHNLYITHEGLSIGERGEAFDALCEKHGVAQGDSGSWMIPPYATEMDLTVPNGELDEFLEGLKGIGFSDLHIQDSDGSEL